MLVLSCSLWAVLKVVGSCLNIVPAALLMYYLKDDKAIRKGFLPVIGLVLYVGSGYVMFYSIKAARAAEIVQVSGPCP